MGRVSATWLAREKNRMEFYGAIYRIDSAHKTILDRFEGNGYHDSQLTVEFHGQEYSCLTYLAQPSYIQNSLKPFHWYKELIVLGARHLRFPDAYVRSIESIESVDDPDEERQIQHQSLIARILQYSNS